MRSVSFVDRLELDFSGNHFSHALALGDVDSDGVSNRSETSLPSLNSLSMYNTC